MKIEKISASAYKKYYECPHAYFIEQQLKWRFPFGKAADTGTIVHAILEYLAELKKAYQNQSPLLEVSDICLINKQGLDIDINLLCEQIFECYIKNKFSNQDWKDADLKNVKKYVNTAITHNSAQFNPLNRNVVHTERYISLPLEQDWAVLPDGERLKITGFIDLECEVSDDTLEIIDWKSGKTGQDRTYDEIKLDIQLGLYFYALNKLLSDKYKNFLVTIFYLQNKRPVTVNFTQADLKSTEDRIRHTVNKIAQDNLPHRNQSWKCKKWCSYGKETFEGTHIKSQDQFMPGGIARIGEKMTICDQCHFEVIRNGMDWTINNMQKPKDENAN